VIAWSTEKAVAVDDDDVVRRALACHTILFDVDVPLVTKKQYGVEDPRRLRSAAATGLYGRAAGPAVDGVVHVRAQHVLAEELVEHLAHRTLQERDAAEWPGQCHEYEPSGASSPARKRAAPASRNDFVSRMMCRATNSGVSSNMWMKPCSPQDVVRDAATCGSRRTGRSGSAFLADLADEIAQVDDAGSISGPRVNSSSSIDRMNAEAR
jgi:hypothetical protein